METDVNNVSVYVLLMFFCLTYVRSLKFLAL